MYIARDLLCTLGFIPNDKKSVYEPTQVLEMLGFIINSITMRLHLPDSKAEHVIFLCNQMLQNPTCSIRHLCMVIGVLVSTFPAVLLGQLFYRNLERCKIYHLRKNGWNYNKNCTKDFKCVKELKWWCSNALHSSVPINRDPPKS